MTISSENSACDEVHLAGVCTGELRAIDRESLFESSARLRNMANPALVMSKRSLANGKVTFEFGSVIIASSS